MFPLKLYSTAFFSSATYLVSNAKYIRHIKTTTFSYNLNPTDYTTKSNHPERAPPACDSLIPVKSEESVEYPVVPVLKTDRWILLKKQKRKEWKDSNIRLTYYPMDVEQKQNVS